ncbi:MAG: acyl carrier protein [Rubrobacter sp.]|nr:acyl carrier protein [Rubrobacter sp.]
MSTDTVKSKAVIHEWLQEHVGIKGELPYDYPLIEKGLLTSLQVMELVMFIEGEYGVTIEDDDIVEENFATVNDVVGLIEQKGE